MQYCLCNIIFVIAMSFLIFSGVSQFFLGKSYSPSLGKMTGESLFPRKIDWGVTHSYDNGSLVLWFSGSLVLWFPGLLVLLFAGSLVC